MFAALPIKTQDSLILEGDHFYVAVPNPSDVAVETVYFDVVYCNTGGHLLPIPERSPELRLCYGRVALSASTTAQGSVGGAALATMTGPNLLLGALTLLVLLAQASAHR